MSIVDPSAPTSTGSTSVVALAMAEALSLAIRDADRSTALRRLRACSGDPAVLRAAAQACRGFDQVDEVVVRRAASWLESAARRRHGRGRAAAGNMRQAIPRLS